MLKKFPEEEILKLPVGMEFSTRITHENLAGSPIEGNSFYQAEILDDKGKPVGLVDVLVSDVKGTKLTKSDRITIAYQGTRTAASGRVYPVFSAYRELAD
jgi:hypothetical protein